MSEEATVQDRGGTTFDDPNREAVGLEPAWVEGTGGGGEAPVPTAEPEATPAAVELAEERGIDLGEVEGTGQEGRITKPDVEGASEPAGEDQG